MLNTFSSVQCKKCQQATNYLYLFNLNYTKISATYIYKNVLNQKIISHNVKPELKLHNVVFVRALLDSSKLLLINKHRILLTGTDWTGLYILVRRSVLRRIPRTVAPDAYWISLRIPFHFLSFSSYLMGISVVGH